MSRSIQQLEETKRKTLLANSPEAMKLLAASSSTDDQPTQGKGKGKNKKKKGGQGNFSKEKEDEIVKKLEAGNKNMEKEIEQIKLDWETEKAKLAEQKEALSKKCQEIQVKIKEKKSKNKE
jgi:hypothetical protein